MIGWTSLTDGEKLLYKHYNKDGQEFTFGVRINKAWIDRAREAWCTDRHYAYRLSYIGRSRANQEGIKTAYHVFWFKEESQAIEFAREQKGFRLSP